MNCDQGIHLTTIYRAILHLHQNENPEGFKTFVQLGEEKYFSFVVINIIIYYCLAYYPKMIIFTVIAFFTNNKQ